MARQAPLGGRDRNRRARETIAGLWEMWWWPLECEWNDSDPGACVLLEEKGGKRRFIAIPKMEPGWSMFKTGLWFDHVKNVIGPQPHRKAPR